MEIRITEVKNGYIVGSVDVTRCNESDNIHVCESFDGLMEIIRKLFVEVKMKKQ